MKDDLNPVDHKSYVDYYVESKAIYLKDTKGWSDGNEAMGK
jgi:hypothetical protein